jgi:hypothetical protein
MSNALLQNEEQKKMKVYAIRATIVYVLLLPELLWFAAMSIMITDGPPIPTSVVTAFMCIQACIPLSVPFTIYFIWSRYLRKNYKSCRRCCFIPLYVFCGTLILDVFLEFII